MAQNRPAIPRDIKRALLQQTGYKCANPGCSNRLLEIHHIDQWAIYQTHDQESMIAICPSCHDAVTRGSLTISDDELYLWKGIERTSSVLTGHLFIEPTQIPRLILGRIEFTGPEGITIIEFDRTKLSLAIRDQELGIVNLKTIDSRGEPLLDVIDNYVRQRNPGIEIMSRPGRYQVVAEDLTQVYPSWAIDCLSRAPSPRNNPAHFGALDIEVLEPGAVRVKGALLDDNGGLVMDDDQTILLSRKQGVALAFKVDGPGRAMLYFMNPLNRPALGSTLPEDFW
jgi:hypothetical protein